MKKIITIACLLLSISANATIKRLSNGTTYCVSEIGGNYIIDWKQNTITLILAGSDTYKIIKESINRDKSELILTARHDWYPGAYTEFKLFSNSSGDFFRAWDNSTKRYLYHLTRLSCWNEE